MNHWIAATLIGLLATMPVHAEPCNENGVRLQVLGSGGEALVPGRAASGYLVWKDQRARLLVDTGSGVALRFRQSGADVEGLDAVLYTQLRVGHSGDLPALASAWQQSGRRRPLPLLGPGGSMTMPSTISFVRALFDQKRGAFRHLGDFVSPLGTRTFKLKPHDVAAKRKPHRNKNLGRQKPAPPVQRGADYRLYALAVSNGRTPGLAWRIHLDGKKIVIAGDLTRITEPLIRFAQGADLLVVHQSAHSGDEGHATTLSGTLGSLAYRSRARHLIVSHRIPSTLEDDKTAINAIKNKYAGIVSFADDLSCFDP